MSRAAAFSLLRPALLTRLRPLAPSFQSVRVCACVRASSPRGLTRSLFHFTCPSGPAATATMPTTEAQTLPPRTCVPVPAAWVEEGKSGSPGVTRALVMCGGGGEKEKMKSKRLWPDVSSGFPSPLPSRSHVMPLLSFFKPAMAGPPAIKLVHDHGFVLAVLVATVLV